MLETARLVVAVVIAVAAVGWPGLARPGMPRLNGFGYCACVCCLVGLSNGLFARLFLSHCFISRRSAITKRNQQASRKRVKGRRTADNECRHIANDKILSHGVRFGSFRSGDFV